MVAVENGKQTPLGVVYNELPDRVSDSLRAVYDYDPGVYWSFSGEAEPEASLG